jgi:hypothetical protein
MRFSALPRGGLLAAVCCSALPAQITACPGGVVAPYFGWDATECGNCNIYGSYLEYLTPPGLRSIRPGGPAAGRVRENDTLVAVEGSAITTPAAWHQLRDAEPGRAIHVTLRRAGDTTTTTIVPSTRCVPEPPSVRAFSDRGARQRGQVPRSIVVGGAVVEISGDPESVTVDPKTGEAVIVSGRTVVRVKPKP